MGEATIIGDQPTAVPLPNSEQFYLDSEQGETYLIQVSWPLHWQGDSTPDQGSFPIMYVLVNDLQGKKQKRKKNTH